MSNFKDANSATKLSGRLLPVLVSLLGRHRATARKFKILGEHLDFHLFVRDKWGEVPYFRTRESLWKEMVSHLNGPTAFYEFGVAHGYLTNFFLNHFDKIVLSWNGFDRFVGLPNSWRDLDVGAFSNGGVPPAIEDHRISWHVGDVEQTFNETMIENRTSCYIFDLDLYGPSRFVWEVLRSKLKDGDVLYFDEAFDTDERRLINEEIVNKTFTIIGYTPSALAVKVKLNSDNKQI